MKKALLIFTLFIATNIAFGQKKDKIKGSKIVTIEKKKIENFNSLEVSDELEITLVKGTECGLEIEADDNLHEAIAIEVANNNIKISTTKDIISAKKVSIRITYTDAFTSVTSKNESSVIALSELDLGAIEFKSFDSSKLFLNAKVGNFKLQMNDKSYAEINLKSDQSSISLSKNSKLKALIASLSLTIDMYQKTNAVVEGDTEKFKLRLDNNASFTGNNLTSKEVEISTESYTTASVHATNSLKIAAVGKSEISIFGDPKIEVEKFSDNAVLQKKPTK
ncbi:MAG: DUF2807 domain-containing protein [Flavobacterium sp.]|nr:DUF2807 domain-containing protein [Flavobacterium sp.]